MAWQKREGLAKDIAISYDGDIWVIGTNPVPGGFGIFFWRGDFWIPVTGGGVRIAVGRGKPVVVNDRDDIHQLAGITWKQLQGKAKDISAQSFYLSPDDEMSVIGTNPVPGGFGIFEWTPYKQWSALSGGAVAVSGGWVVNNNNDIFTRDGGGWKQMPGKARDIANYSSTTWAIGTKPVAGGFEILKWDGSNSKWDPEVGGAVRIALGGSLIDPTVFRGPCVVNDRDEIYRWV